MLCGILPPFVIMHLNFARICLWCRKRFLGISSPLLQLASDDVWSHRRKFDRLTTKSSVLSEKVFKDLETWLAVKLLKTYLNTSR